MSKFKPDYTSHGNYKCPYCNHKVWKSESPATKHIEEKHPMEALEAWHIIEMDRVETEKANLEYKLKQYSKPPEKKQEYYNANVFCTSCKYLSNCGMPMGSEPGNVTCPHCGVCALHLVANVKSFWSL